MLGKRGELRVFASGDEDQWGPFKFGPRWIYVPTYDVYAYARRTGRETEALKRWPGWLESKDEGEQ